MTAYFWSKACPGLYYLWDGPKDSGRNPIGKVERAATGFYEIKMIRSDSQPSVHRAPWTPRSAMDALERHVRQPRDTFTAEF